MGELIAPKNKRNTKNINLKNSYKSTNKTKKLLKLRYRIEFTNNKLKQFRRIDKRYDKFGMNYLNYVYLAAIDIILKN